MRNLKRALSLAVSTVMLIGMMAVGTSAASYADVTSEHNEEAIGVMQAVSVMVGDENGNFNPDKNVTRAEMAVVMANLLDLQVQDFVGASIPFTDVPEWARAYVAACYADGITGGISATEYGSNNSVTSVQPWATSSLPRISAPTGRWPPSSRPATSACMTALTPPATRP